MKCLKNYQTYKKIIEFLNNRFGVIMKGKLEVNQTNFRFLKGLLIDILFSGDKLDDVAKKHRNVDGKEFFKNIDDFDFGVEKNFVGKEEVIDNDLDKVITKFMNDLKRTQYTLKQRGNKK